jgi:hypothetical protein
MVGGDAPSCNFAKVRPSARREKLKVIVAALEHRLRTIVTTTPEMTTEAA